MSAIWSDDQIVSSAVSMGQYVRRSAPNTQVRHSRVPRKCNGHQLKTILSILHIAT